MLELVFQSHPQALQESQQLDNVIQQLYKIMLPNMGRMF